MKGGIRTGMKNIVMNVVIKSALAPALIALAFAACENPFRAGLGPLVDIHDPTVSLVSPAPGSSLRGTQEFSGIAWDDMGVEWVQFMIIPGPYYESLAEMLREGFTEQDLEERRLLGWQTVNLSSSRNRDGYLEWRYGIDTRIFRDGPLHIRLRVMDRADKKIENADDKVFFIRNNPPAISMEFPRLARGEARGRLGSAHLNYNFGGNFENLNHRVDTLIGVSGTITDDNGLFVGPAEDGRFPPQFRVWEVHEPGTLPAAVGLPGIPQYPADALPELPWRSIGGSEPDNHSSYFVPNPAANPAAFMFFYSFPPEAQGRRFAIQVRAQSSAGEADGSYPTASFPRDEWSDDGWAGLSASQQIENSFVAFLVDAPQEPPRLELLRFQNILDDSAWDQSLNDGRGEYADIPGVGENHEDVWHPYIVDAADVKNGAFTLRVRASHIEGVGEAVAFWEGGGERGLFIWDAATRHWNDESNVDTGNRFTMWGYADPNIRTPPTRSFIFTYRDDGDGFLDGGSSIHEGARGRYRIQRFTGSDWDGLYADIHEQGGWDALLSGENWADADDFWHGREGTFKISVHARSARGTVSSVPLVTTLSIDRQPPTVALGEIAGSAGEILHEATGETVHVVNGVIKPRFAIGDNASGLRDFTRPGMGPTEEVMFVLVHDSPEVRTAMNSLGEGFWPLLPGGNLNDRPPLPPVVEVYGHGLVVDRGMSLHTRTVYGESGIELADGSYRLYVFARDRAFNVGRESFPIRVNAESDRPRFYFDMGINPQVRDPSVSPGVPSRGFVFGGNVRNRLRPADNIGFTIRDDDGLDLSTLRISFTGSFVDDAGEIRPRSELDPGYLIEFGADKVFGERAAMDAAQVFVRELLATITQPMLLGLLRANDLYRTLFGLEANGGDGLHSLPDGIYRIRMEIYDNSADKLSMPGETAAAIRSRPVEFWIAVDELRPEIAWASPEDADFISATGTFSRTGTVSDGNGPIEIVGFTVRNAATGQVVNILDKELPPAYQNLEWVSLVRRTDAGKTWKYDFTALISMDTFFPDISSGEFVFELGFRDRFGNMDTVRRSYFMDGTPPSVALRPGMGIATFARPSAAGRIPADSVGMVIGNIGNGLEVSRLTNVTRLANNVLRFAVDAADDFAVGGIHWWLLPATTGSRDDGLFTVPTGGKVESFWSFPAMEANPQAVLGTRGAFGRIAAPGGEAVIDTSGLNLPDGEYRLHVIAIDGAGNESLSVGGITGSVAQTVFLFQAEDKPYFTSGIRPSGGEGRGHDLVVTGVVTDDDGFGMGMFPDPGSVEIWISTNDLPAGVEPGSATLAQEGWHRAVPSSGLSLIEGTNLVLELDLLALFPSFFADSGDGMKFYVIRAQDSHANKFSPNGLPAAPGDRVASYSRVFHFMRDVRPPELELVSPVHGQTVGDDNFYLVGAIADANLRRYDGSPYLLWRLDQGGLARFLLSEAYVFEPAPGEAVIEAADGIEVVHFRIPHADIFGANIIDSLGDGSHTLELRVEDLPGAFAEVSRSFVIDTTPPTVNLRTGITTFARTSAAERIPLIDGGVGIVSPAIDNATRLANKVLGFAVDATDNIAVGSIHWWLLPADTGSGETDLVPGGKVDSFWSFPAREADPQAVLGARGAFGRIDPPGGEVLIDSFALGLPDGEYRLHIIAVDGAGNESVAVGGMAGSLAQTVFLFQAEDRPYFGAGIRPAAGEVRGNDLVVTGIVTDDDGFGTGMFLDPESVEIWISTDNLPAGVEPSSATLAQAGWHRAVPASGLSLVESTNLVLEIDLLALFPSFFAQADDGRKYYVIRAQDSAANKLEANGNPATRVASYSQVFSFMRDILPPELELVSPSMGQAVANDTFFLEGAIADANLRRLNGNPFLLWRLNGQGALAGFELGETHVFQPEAGEAIIEAANGIEVVHFRIPHADIFGVNTIPNLSDGNHTLELRVEDKPGAFADVSRSFIIDRTPPSVGLRTGIATFARPSAAGRIPADGVGIIANAEENAARLANKVLGFVVDVTDNISVGGIHWWLLPADVGANENGLAASPGGGTVASFMSFPAGEANPQAVLGTRGAFGRIAAPGAASGTASGAASGDEVFIDTYGLGLPDGEYRLHVVAIDQAGNESFAVGGITGSVAQTVFLFQAEDKPYFAPSPGIRPAGGELRGRDIVVAGVITDDDGFGTGMSPDPGSVEIWVSNTNLPHGVRPSSAALSSAGWHRAVVANGLSLIEGTNLVLEVDLLDANLAWHPPFEFGEGMTFYVVRALDSIANKQGPASLNTQTAGYSEVFSFMRDALPPELVLAHPLPGQTVAIANFELRGSIADANLQRRNGNPFLLWRLNGHGAGLAEFELAPVYVTGTELDGLETVHFEIPSARVLELFDGILNDGLGNDGSNILELRVEDLTGASTEISRSFIIDRTPPTSGLNIPETELRALAYVPPGFGPGDDLFEWWWNEPENPAARRDWNDARRRWAGESGLPVIVADGGVAWLGGSFADTVSDIDLSSARFRINDEETERTWFRHEGPGRTVNWSIPLTVDGTATGQPLPGGVHTISVTVADVAGNAQTDSGPPPVFAFRIDGDLPEASLDPQPHSVFGIPGGDSPVFTLRGTARDANLRNVRLEFPPRAGRSLLPNHPHRVELVTDDGRPSADNITVNWIYDDGVLALEWSFAVNRLDWNAADLEQGTPHEVIATAVDWRGEESEGTVWSFSRDVTPPAFDFPGRATTADGSLGPGSLGAAFNLVDRGAIQAAVTDAHSDIHRMQRQLERWHWSAAGQDGWLPVHVYEEGDRISDADGWAEISGYTGTSRNRIWNMAVAGLPEEGLYRMRLRAMDSSWFAGSVDDFVDNGSGNHSESYWLYFYYDTAAPAIDFSPPMTMSSRFGTGTPAPGASGYLRFNVVVTDDNRLNDIVATITNSAGVPVGTKTVNVFGTNLAAENVFDITIPLAHNAPDGVYSLAVTARDLAERVAVRIESFTLDNSPPAGQFHSPLVNQLAGERWTISGETIDPSAVAGMYFRIGLIDDGNDALVLPSSELLARFYTGEAAAHDTARNNHIFSESDSWFLLDENAAMPAYFELVSGSSFGWQLEVSDSSALTAFLQNGNDMIAWDGGIIELPIWFRAVDGLGNAGYFGQNIRIDPEADRPRLRIDTPTETIAAIENQRGGRVDFAGFAQIPARDLNVHSVLYRVWVGAQGAARPAHRVTEAELRGAVPAADPDLEGFLDGLGLWEGGGWFRASASGTGNNVPWSFSLNSGFELSELISVHGFAHPDGGEPNTLFVWVEMITLNGVDHAAKASVGGGSPEAPAPYVVGFYLRSSAPQILHADVDGIVYWDGSPLWSGGFDPHRERFTITTVLDAAAGQTLSEVRIARGDERLGDHGLVPAWENPAVNNGGGGMLHGLQVVPRSSATNAAVPPNHDGRFWTLVYVLDSKLRYPYGTAGQAGSVAAVRGGEWAQTGGEYRVEIRIRDNSSPRVETTLTLPIRLDNFAPAVDASFNGNRFQAGTRGEFQGRVFDFRTHDPGDPLPFAAPVGVDRIYAWFEKRINGERHFVSINETGSGAFTMQPATGNELRLDNVFHNRTATLNDGGVMLDAPGTPGSVNMPENFARFVRTISGANAAGNPNMLWLDPNEDGSDVLWQFSLNSVRLPDGPVSLMYVVLDTAGNAGFHEQHIVVRNSFPVISRVVLHTSTESYFDNQNRPVRPGIDDALNGDPQRSMVLSPMMLAQTRPAGYIDSGFAARHRFLGFTVETTGGNAPLHYRLQPVTRQELTLGAQAFAQMVADRNGNEGINLYTIADRGDVSDLVWEMLGVVGEPSAGTHFVFAPNDTYGLPLSTTARVWRYVSIGDVDKNLARETGPLGLVNGNNPVALPIGNAGDDFNFFDNDFATHGVAPSVPPAGIPQFVLRPGPFEGPNEPDEPHRPFFLLRVWDSVTKGHGEVDDPVHHENFQLHVAAVIYMDILLFDDVRPGVEFHGMNPDFERGVTGHNLTEAARAATIRNALNPQEVSIQGGVISETNSGRGGLFNAGTFGVPARSGHIDPDFPAGVGNDGNSVYRDHVSGRVILRGRATDNQLLQSLELQIGETGAWFPILEWRDGEMRVPQDAGFEPYRVGVSEFLDWRYGHVVEWSFLWDTELFNNGAPMNDVRISARVTDAAGLGSDANGGANGEAPASKNVNVVPYITGFERAGHYATIRSNQGWYSFYQGETGIRALGFNLGGTGAIGTAGGIGLTGPAGSGVPVREGGSSPVGGRTRIAFGIPANAQSGRVNFVIDAIPIHNHRSDHETRPWNRESFFGGHAELWTNKPYAHVWRTGHDSSEPRTYMGPTVSWTPSATAGGLSTMGHGSLGASHPGMALEYSGTGAVLGRLHGTWGVFGHSMVHLGRNDGTGVGTADHTGTEAGTNVTTLLDNMRPNDPVVMPDISLFNGAARPNFTLVHMSDGGPSVRFRSGANLVNSSTGGSASAFPTMVSNANITGGGSTRRWQNPRASMTNTAATGATTRFYASVFDADNQNIVVVGRFNTTSRFRAAVNPAGSNTDSFSAIGFDSSGPIVAFFNRTAGTLQIAAGPHLPGTSVSNNNTWQAGWDNFGVRNVPNSSSASHVSMAIDRNNGIHLAFVNTNEGEVVYAFSANRGTTFTTMVVDNLRGIGSWTDISVDHWGNPWIVYGIQAREGGVLPDSVRVAYRTHNAQGQGRDGHRFTAGNNDIWDIANWEAVQMAAPFVVGYDRLNIETWPPTRRDTSATGPAVLRMADSLREGGTQAGREWSAAIGYIGTGQGGNSPNDTSFRIGYFFNPEALPPLP